MFSKEHSADVVVAHSLPPTPPTSVTPTHPMSSRSASPRGFGDVHEPEGAPEVALPPQKKKKKKKPKKSKVKDEAVPGPKESEGEKLPVLCISRNKHWRYISSYHGPWLQLPLELLESLLALNMDPNTFAPPDTRIPIPPPLSPPSPTSVSAGKQRGFSSPDLSPPPSPPAGLSALSGPFLPLPDLSGRPTPPPIDPGVFTSVTNIRRLIDEASDLAVRAASGLSAAALGSLRAPGAGSAFGLGMNGGSWAAAQSFGINPAGDAGGSGRNTAMSAMRVHRLRAMAVQRLAAAYRADEIAASVMVMQGASALDDIAERVLRVEPSDADARYVHFFHEKIPSRQLAESTTTKVLDELIAAHPQRLEFYRTRGIVRCFRDEYQLATRDFTHALKEAKNARKAKHAHSRAADAEGLRVRGKKGRRTKTHGRAPADGTAVAEGPEGDGPTLPVHPSVLPDAPSPLEPQLLFLRGAAYLQNAVFLIEEAILGLEGIRKAPPADGAELRLCYLEGGRYGGIEIGNPAGPLGAREGAKAQAYRAALGAAAFREQVAALLRKSVRDHEKFLGHFDTLDAQLPVFMGDAAQRTRYAFLLTESLRPGSHGQAPALHAPPAFTTYHPLLVESHFSILLATLLMGEFAALLPAFARAATLVDGLEGYPVFLPARSMAQAEFIEVLERLAGGWRAGVQPRSRGHSQAVLTGPSSSSSSAPPTERGAAPHPLAEALDCARILLAPVAQRQKERTEQAAAEKASGMDKKRPLSINIPLHGPRVEIVLAWLGAVHLPELESVAGGLGRD